MNPITLYTHGSILSGQNLFFDILNIKFEDIGESLKCHKDHYNYKGNQYDYSIYFIDQQFENSKIFNGDTQYCDCVIFLADLLNVHEFQNVKSYIESLAINYSNLLIVLIMQNVFGNIEELPEETQAYALESGTILCDIETNYNIKLCSLNYDLDELSFLQSGDPMVYFKFQKLFNETFYDILHECIERRNNPDKKQMILSEEL